MQLAVIMLAAVLSLTSPAHGPIDSKADAVRPTPSGIAASTYTGRWYDPAADPFRRCVIAREAPGGNYAAANPRSSARGAYQFLDRAWRHGLAHDVAKAITATRSAFRAVRAALRAVPINRWSRLAQDAAFWVAYRHGAGWRHWYHPGSRCNGLATVPPLL